MNWLKHLLAKLFGVATREATVQASKLSLEDQNSLRAHCIRPLVWGGFEARDDLFEAAHTHLSEPQLDSTDISWIENEIERQWSEKKRAEATWPSTTDFDRLDAVFQALETNRILALHNAGYTQSDAHGDAGQDWHDRGGQDSSLRGFIFYHGQDVERVIDDGQLYIGYGLFEGSSAAPINIARQAVDALVKAGFTAAMPQSESERILVTGLDWKKRSPE